MKINGPIFLRKTRDKAKKKETARADLGLDSRGKTRLIRAVTDRHTDKLQLLLSPSGALTTSHEEKGDGTQTNS